MLNRLAIGPGPHTAIVDEDVKVIDFSPTKEHDELMAHVGRKMAESAEPAA